jgi:phage shock protein PspC (stress-responsive transcriptional regulator)
VLGGVLAGVGDRIGMAPAPTRVIFVLIGFFTGGLALLVYAAAWALLPDTAGRIVIQDFGRGRPNVGALVALGILTVFGLIFLDRNLLSGGWGWLSNMPSMGSIGHGFPGFGRVFAVLIPLAVLAGLAWLIVWAISSSRRGAPAHGYARLPDGTVPATPADTTSAGAEPSADAAATEAPVPPAAPATYAAMPATASGQFIVQTPPVYTAPPRPPRPRVPGPGKVGYLLALAWIPITMAITLYLATTDQLAVFPVVAGGVIYVAGLGVILVITALRGRKLGFLGFVSVLALLPVGAAIATAPDLREHYSAGDWRAWWEGSYREVTIGEPAPIYTPPPAFDPSTAFLDFETVAISGSCYEPGDLTTPDTEGTVRLSSVPADQTITVSSNSTRLVIPEGTSLRVIIVDHTTNDENGWSTSASVSWPGRDVSCDTSYGATDAVTLTNADKPVLTVRLDDAQQSGSMSLWIEED